MKRITVILLTCLLTICGCTKNKSKESEEPQAPIVFVDPDFEIETPQPGYFEDFSPLSFYDYEEYRWLCETAVNLPEDFVQYEDVSKWGKFESFKVPDPRQCNCYIYYLKDPVGETFSLVIHHKNKEENAVSLDKNAVNRSNMRECKSAGVYAESGLYYRYNKQNKLTSICWKNNNIWYTIETRYDKNLSDYPENVSSPVNKMLNVDTALEFLGLVH